MIAVRLLGGARKALDADSMEIDADSATVGEILAALESRTSGALVSSNVLVAVNGADSSAAGGGGAVVRAGDDVAIIPVVHGGSRGGRAAPRRAGTAAGGPRMTPLVSAAVADLLPQGRKRGAAAAAKAAKAAAGRGAGAAPGRGMPKNPRTVEAYVVRSGRGGVLPPLDDLRAEFPSVAIQAVSGRFVLGASHLRRVLAVSAAAERRRTMVARRLETDMLARLAGTSQISEAIGAAGRRGADAGTYVVVAVAPAVRLGPLRARLAPLASPHPLPASNARFLARRFGIGAARMAAVAGPGRRPLEDLLVEAAAVAGA